MRCEEVRAYLADHLNGGMSEPAGQEVLGHLNACVDCRRVFQELEDVWEKLTWIPEQPGDSSQMRDRFDSMMAAHEDSLRDAVRIPFWKSQLVYAAAIAAVLALIVFVGTRLIVPTPDGGNSNGASGIVRKSPEKVTPRGALTGDDGRNARLGGLRSQTETIRTGETNGETRTLTDGSVIEVSPRADLTIEPDANGFGIQLRRGSVIVVAAKQPGGHRLFVRTAQLTASVVGTVFAVTAEAGASRVSVAEGVVRLEQNGASELLTGGEQRSTNPAMKAVTFRDALSWSRNAATYLALPAVVATEEPSVPTQGRGRFRISGRVSGYDSLHEVGPVTLTSPTVGTRRADIQPDGSFQFLQVPEGRFTVGLRRGISIPPISVQVAGQDITNLNFPPLRKVYGQVVFEGGPPTGVLWMSLTDSSTGQTVALTAGPINGRFSNLLPEGEYRLKLNPERLPSGYRLQALEYGSTDLLSAPLRIDQSNTQDLRVTIRVPPQALHTVRGRVNGLSSDGAPRTISLSEEVFYLGFGAPLGADGIFEIHGVPSGAYQLQWRSDGLTFTKVVTIRNADLNGVELDTPRLREVPIDVSVDNGNPVPKFSLRLNGLTTVSIAGSTGSDFSLQKKLPEGAYKIDIPSLPSGYTVKSFTYGGTDLLRNPIHVSAEDLAGMRINFATRLDPPVKVAGTILGFVSLTPTPKISIGSAIQTIETFINADGSFEFPRVFPGRNNLYLSMPDVTADVPGGSVTINVPATGLTGLKLIMVPIRLKVEGSQAPKTLLVGASRKDGVLPSSTSGTRADGSRWILLTQGEQEIDAAYAVVRSVRYGGVEIGNRLTISAKDPISELSITIGFRP